MCTEAKDRILRRIRSLLELAQSEVNEAEAIAAAMKAQELLAQYDIDESEVDVTTKLTDEIGEEDIYDVTKVGWDRNLAAVIAKDFRCEAIVSGRGILKFIGFKRDIAVAFTTYKFLRAVAENLWTKRFKENKKNGVKGNKMSYMLGFVAGVKAKLDENCTALKLVVPKEVNDYMGDNYPKLRKSRPAVSKWNSNDYNSGKVDGKNSISSRSLSGQRALMGA